MQRLTIAHYMTPSPHTIGKSQSLRAAHDLMRQHGIRHLPVLDRGTLVGIVTLRDLHLVETLKDVDPLEVTVEEAMSPDPFQVGPRASLVKVARTMSERRIGCAIVVERSKVIGVFTAVDALRVLAEIVDASFAASRKTLRPTAPS